MALSYPSATNVFVPSHKASAGLMTGFSRNPKDFAINKYAQILPTDKPIGLYATWNSRQAARIRNTDLRDWTWKDGADAASGNDNLEAFGYIRYETTRYAFPFALGDMTVKSADWNVLQAHAEMVAHQAMTGREALAYSVWGAAANWGTHCANVDGVATALNGNAAILASGQNWTNGTADVPNIKKTFNRARVAIVRDTLAVLKPKDIRVVISPNTAMQMAESPEIHSYLARSQFALAQVKGDVDSQNGEYGLPDTLYGSELVIDDTVIDTAQKSSNPAYPSTETVSFLIPDGEALFTSRIGGLEGIGGGPAHSTIVIFYYQDDMTVESYHDVNNRLTRGRVVTNFTTVLSTPFSGYYVRRALG